MLLNNVISIPVGAEEGLTKARWEGLHDDNGVVADDQEVYRLVYYGGVEHDIRKDVWPYLLGHYSFGKTPEERAELDETTKHYYETTMSEWLAVEAIVRQRDKEKTAVAVAKLSSGSGSVENKSKEVDEEEMENEVFEEDGFSDMSEPEMDENEEAAKLKQAEPVEEPEKSEIEEGEKLGSSNLLELPLSEHSKDIDSNKSSPSDSSYATVGNDFVDVADMLPVTNNEIVLPNDEMDEEEEEEDDCSTQSPGHPRAVIVTDASIDVTMMNEVKEQNNNTLDALPEEGLAGQLDALQEPKSTCVSPASSNGGIYSVSRNGMVPTVI